jgi:signal transduction histidine kinase
MRTSTVASRRPPGWLIDLLARPAPAPGTPARAGLFQPRLRRIALCWVCLSLPVVVLVGTLATTPTAYLVVFAVLASGFYTSPAILHTLLAARRAPKPDDRSWWLWLAALTVMYGIGVAMLLALVVEYRTPTALNTAVVGLTAALLMLSIVVMAQSRSGRRAMSVDLIESVMSVIVVVAPAALVWGDDVVHAEEPWYAVPAAVALVAMVFGCYWSVLLYTRLRLDGGAPRAIGRIGVALALVGLANALGQTMQGVTGFDLPSGPLLGLHALCMSLLLFIPLFVPDRISPGLDRLPLAEQVRGAWLPAVLMFVGLPVLLTTTIGLRDRYAWAPLYALVVTSVLLVLAALRQLAAAAETRRLYHQVERAAATRRHLLAGVMQRADEDRHRVAAQLHEQAVAAYASFVSFIQAGALVRTGSKSMGEASEIVRHDLRAQAESLRQLMLAVQPLEAGRPRPESLGTPIQAYVDGLYGDRRTPRRRIEVDGVDLDWSTETIVLRIVQEAVRNVWRHSEATAVDITIRADGPVVVVEVVDDGVGFEPSEVMFESGIAAMRSFAQLGQGSMRIDSAPGRGTRVTARLGEPGAPPEGSSGDDAPPPAWLRSTSGRRLTSAPVDERVDDPVSYGCRPTPGRRSATWRTRR